MSQRYGRNFGNQINSQYQYIYCIKLGRKPQSKRMILPDHRVPQNIPKPNCHHLPPIRIFGYIIFIIYWDMFGACTQFFFIDTPRYQVSILFLNHNLFVALLLFAEHLKLGPLHFELHGQSTLTQLGGFKVLRHRRICTCGWEILRYPREVWKSNFRHMDR